eukprot:10261807-Karenia_brevis.AAC.1
MEAPPVPTASSSTAVETSSLAAALATPFAVLLPQVSVVSAPKVVTQSGVVNASMDASGGAHPHHVAPAFPSPDPLQSALTHIPADV